MTCKQIKVRTDITVKLDEIRKIAGKNPEQMGSYSNAIQMLLEEYEGV